MFKNISWFATSSGSSQVSSETDGEADHSRWAAGRFNKQGTYKACPERPRGE